MTPLSQIIAALALLLLLAGTQAKEKQIKLEDIERDNLAAERHAKSSKHEHQHQPSPENQYQLQQGLQGHGHYDDGSGSYQPLGQSFPTGNLYLSTQIPLTSGHHNQYPQQQHHQQSQGMPTPPRMQYGFVPLKPQPGQHQSSHQDQTKYQYLTSSHSYTQAFLPPLSGGSHVEPVGGLYPELHSSRVQYAGHQPEEQSSGLKHSHRYAVPIQTQAYQQYMAAQKQGHQGHTGLTHIQYIPEKQLQQHYQYQAGHSGQYQQSQQQPQLQEQQQQQSHMVQGHAQIQPQGYIHSQRQPQSLVQYVVDNSLQTNPQPPQDDAKYPSYVYLQSYQTPSASSNIHSITDIKGNVQYVMYLPATAPGSISTYPAESVLAYPQNPETQYLLQAVPENSPVSSATSPGVSGITVARTRTSPVHHSAYDLSRELLSSTVPKRYERPVFKQQPTSLLDSYVPSYLQYQYYKQQQVDTANSIKQSLKLTSTDVGKTDVVKTHKSETSHY